VVRSVFHLILNYHAINHDGLNCHDDAIYSIQYEDFKKQLDLIQNLHCQVVALQEAITMTKQSTISLTFDDGHASDCLLVLPLLEQYGYKASFFIPAENLENDPEKLSACKKLLAAGHYVGPHGYAHIYYNALPPKRQYRDMLKARETFKVYLDLNPTILALPGGKYNQFTAKLAKKAGYRLLLGTGFSTCRMGKQGFLLSRWTIKNYTSLTRFSSVLQQQKMHLGFERAKAFLKFGLHRLLPNHVTIRLSYVFRKWR